MKLLTVLRFYLAYSKYFLPIIGILALLLNIISEQQKARDWFRKANSIPSGRLVPIGVSDGVYVQVKVEKGKKSDPKPQGVKPETVTKLEGRGKVKPVSRPKGQETSTADLIRETEKYLRQ